MSSEKLSISERLSLTTDQIKRLQILENIKKNQEQQEKNDYKFQELVHQTAQLCRTVHFAQRRFAFPYQPETELVGMLDELQAVAMNEAVDEDSISRVKKKLIPTQDQARKAWDKYYPSLVGSVSSTLKIIQKIAPDLVDRCLTDIQNAAGWKSDDSGLLCLEALAKALINSNAVIERLNLDQEITAFLTKVSLGTSTMDDLSDGVLSWIRRENLSGKIKITFK